MTVLCVVTNNLNFCHSFVCSIDDVDMHVRYALDNGHEINIKPYYVLDNGHEMNIKTYCGEEND